MRWSEIYLEIKIRNIRQKKYVAVKDQKLHNLQKIDPVNFFLQCIFFLKKIKNKKFWKEKNQYSSKLNSPKVGYY